MRDSAAVPLSEESQVGEARRIAVALAAELGCSETEFGILVADGLGYGTPYSSRTPTV